MARAKWELKVEVDGAVVEVVARVVDIALVASNFGLVKGMANFVVVTT